jgi:hypothetical protein
MIRLNRFVACAGITFAAVAAALTSQPMLSQSPPAGFVPMPDSLNCSAGNLMSGGGASSGGKFVLQSIGSITCKSPAGQSARDIPLVDGNLNNGMLATKSFGDFFVESEMSRFPQTMRIYIRSEQLQPLMEFLDSAPPPPVAKLADGTIVKVGGVFPVRSKKDLKFLRNMEGANLGNTKLPSGTLVPPAPDGTTWTVHSGQIVLEAN